MPKITAHCLWHFHASYTFHKLTTFTAVQSWKLDFINDLIQIVLGHMAAKHRMLIVKCPKQESFLNSLKQSLIPNSILSSALHSNIVQRDAGIMQTCCFTLQAFRVFCSRGPSVFYATYCWTKRHQAASSKMTALWPVLSLSVSAFAWNCSASLSLDRALQRKSDDFTVHPRSN